jgi:DNA-binding Lrp family transcriptional regulator
MSFEPRELTDPRAMRALTHPVRLALIEAMGHAGRPLTATEAGELIGESPTTCSFHLRQLAKYGFVEEAAAGPGRRRPWRLSGMGVRFTDAHEDPEAATAATVLGRVLRARWLDRARASLEDRHALSPEWREATGDFQYVLHVTPEELEGIQREVIDLLTRYHDRAADPSLRPERSRPIEALALFYAIDRPQAGG